MSYIGYDDFIDPVHLTEPVSAALIKGLEYTTKRVRPGPLSLGNLFS